MSHSENNRPAPKRSLSGATPAFELHTWRDYYLIIRERLYLGAAAALLVSGLVGYVLMSQPPVYSSEAALLLDSEGARVLDMQQVVETKLDGSGQMWRISLENHINQLTSRSFRSYVADSFTDEEKERILSPYRNDDEPLSLGAIIRSVLVESVPNSFILRVETNHRDREVAAMISNRYVKRYIDFNKQRSQSGNESARTFLTRQEAEVQEKVEKAEQELENYRRQHNLISIEENENLMAQRLAAISEGLTAARMQRMSLESQIRQVERFQRDDRNLMEIFSLSAVGSTPQVVNEFDQLRKEREVMSKRYGKNHPQMISNQQAIEAAEKLVQENLKLAVANLRSQLSQALEHEGNLIVELREAEEESLELDRVKARYARLQRSVTAARNTHAQILNRLDETSITSQMENSAIRVFDEASVSSNPVQPNTKRIAMLVVFLCGFFFLGTPIGLAALDNKLKNARDVEDFLDQKLLAEISSVSHTKRELRPHVVREGSDDRSVEGFRGLFSQLQVISEKPFPKVLLTTSTIPGEGKTFVVNNLSYCFAAHGKRTLMIDFDLRRPSLHRLYSRMNNTGIIPWLEKEESLTEDPTLEDLGIVEVERDLFLLSAGGQTKKATEAIGHPGVGRMIAALKKEFDMLLIDTPPLGVFPDALPLSQLADESLYVVHFGRVDRQQVKNSLRRLNEADAKLVGVVMNSMPRGSRFSHYYSGYGFGNSEYAKYYDAKL